MAFIDELRLGESVAVSFEYPGTRKVYEGVVEGLMPHERSVMVRYENGALVRVNASCVTPHRYPGDEN
jgi:hypothetical protein